jgi:hypothetical protein
MLFPTVVQASSPPSLYFTHMLEYTKSSNRKLLIDKIFQKMFSYEKSNRSFFNVNLVRIEIYAYTLFEVLKILGERVGCI